MFLQACLIVSGGVVIGSGAGDKTIFSSSHHYTNRRQQSWKELFDGRSLSGWRYYKGVAGNSWEAKDGVLQCKPDKEKGLVRGDLITQEQYQDFELSLEWKIGPGANSGILYLVNEAVGASYESGPEYQLIDDLGYPGKLEDWQKTGANYAMHPPQHQVSKPVGQWNHTRIIVYKSHVEHWLNGTKIVDYQLGDGNWQKLKAQSKWKDTPTYAQSPKGHIVLQDHGGGVAFKEVKIRNLGM